MKSFAILFTCTYKYNSALIIRSLKSSSSFISSSSFKVIIYLSRFIIILLMMINICSRS
ncbi:hypothetical protein [Spiroplasma endosymbiont of Nephrotoma flavescens]|uniref:hypothetical protein n=1 Tax=Spiroplasma endosymbiont of Nephrotoma flavescens TaxID=3066302 RepID=UPI00313ADD52